MKNQLTIILTALTSHRIAFKILWLVMLGLLLRLIFPAASWLSALPLIFFCLCLFLTLLYRWPRLRRQPSMLLAHLSLLLLLLGLLLSPWFRINAYFELAEGQLFQGHFIMHNSGRLAPASPPDWRLKQGTIYAQYDHGTIGKQIHTALVDQHTKQQYRIAYLQPAHVNGYRIKPTGNMGYAAVLSYRDHSGHEERGTVNFPGYPNLREQQSNQFKTPVGKWANATLHMPQWPYREKSSWLLQQARGASINIKTEGKRITLTAGQTVQLKQGQLKLDKIVRWLGYNVTYDPLALILFLAGCGCCLSFLWYWLRVKQKVLI